FFFSSRRRHTRSKRDWSSDVCSSDLDTDPQPLLDELDQRYVPGEIDLDLRDKGIPFVHGKRGTRAYLALSVLALIVVAGILYERSEERRVGKECSARWSMEYIKVKNK